MVRPIAASIRRLLTGITISVGLLANGPIAYAVDLMEVYRLAVKNDPNYLSAGAANRAAQEQTPQARALLLPDLSLSASTDGNYEKTREAGGFGAAGSTQFTGNTFALSLSQPIYRKDLLIGLSQADNRVLSRSGKAQIVDA